MHWDILSSISPTTDEQVIDILLANRSIQSEHALQFFSPKHPLDLTVEEVGIDPAEMARAVQRIQKAKENKEYVIVFGDYDADGVTATAILWETLYEMGVKAMPFIPNREKHGYGISDRSLNDLLKDKKPDLIITVDNGIVAHSAFERLKSEGIDAIITDHHLPEQSSGSSNFKTLNSKQDQSLDENISSFEDPQPTTYNLQPNYPHAYAVVHSTKLCGATVSWFLARELNRQKAGELLDLCAIGTIADQMILLNANRSFASHGVKALQQTKRIGLLNLYQQAKLEAKAISSYSINFVIAPRINAMGRLGSALDALRALCTKDSTKSQELIQILHQTNSDRQELTWTMVDGALKRADEWKDEKIIVLSSPEYHEGVIGLIAGKLVEQFAKPAIVISVGDGVAKASARSISGVNIVDLIRQVRDELIDVGGHPMAAGFSLKTDMIDSVSKRLREIAKSEISDELLVPRITIEAVLQLNQANISLVEMLKKMEPFGNGNADPVFGFKDLQILQVYSLGRERKHLKLVLSTPAYGEAQQSSDISAEHGVVSTQQGFTPVPKPPKVITIECIGFGKGHMEEQLHSAKVLDVAGTLSVNEWNGRKSVQLVIKDVVVK